MPASNRAFRPAVNIAREAPLKSWAVALRHRERMQATTVEGRDKIFFKNPTSGLMKTRIAISSQ
jgi:hypothetical protein